MIAAVLSTVSSVHAQEHRRTFIDAHVHLNDPASWISLMDETGLERALVFRGRSIDNEGLLEAARAWPERLIPFLSVSPEHREYRERWETDDLAVVSIADSLMALGGFAGIGEISPSHFPGSGFPEADFDPNGAVMRGLLEVARRYSVPIVVHVEVTRLREFEELLSSFRDVTVIWAHGGYTPLFLAGRMLHRHPNLVYELSARTWRRHPRSPEYAIPRDGEAFSPSWISLIEQFPDRFVVGTDASLRSVRNDERKILGIFELLEQLAPEVREKVARGNLVQILDSPER